MNIVMIDSSGSAVDFAQRLLQARSKVEMVHIFSGSVSAGAWESERLTVIEKKQIDPPAVIQYCLEKSVSLLVNFDSSYGAAGLLEMAEEAGIKVFGTSRSFAETEMDKRGFKHWMIAQGIQTPAIQMEGTVASIEHGRDNLTYPLVIKPDRQLGPQIQICHTPEGLDTYIKVTVEKQPAAQYGIVFIIEDYIPANHIFQVEYAFGGGQGFVEYTGSLAFVGKSSKNPMGVSCGLSPYPLYERYASTIQDIIQNIIPQDSAGLGFFQAMIDEQGELYVLENNARPGGCRVWFELNDPLALIDGLIAGTLTHSRDPQSHQSDPGVFGLLFLGHNEKERTVNWETINHLPGARFLPFSVAREEGNTVSKQGRPPSVLCAQAPDYAAVRHALAQAGTQLDYAIDDALVDLDTLHQIGSA